jgi:hypothetical protein
MDKVYNAKNIFCNAVLYRNKDRKNTFRHCNFDVQYLSKYTPNIRFYNRSLKYSYNTTKCNVTLNMRLLES